jgi:hypothetical protein
MRDESFSSSVFASRGRRRRSRAVRARRTWRRWRCDASVAGFALRRRHARAMPIGARSRALGARRTDVRRRRRELSRVAPASRGDVCGCAQARVGARVVPVGLAGFIAHSDIRNVF